MNVNKSIKDNTFITSLEKELLTNDSCLNLSFEEFKSTLWTMLCFLEDNYFRKLSLQIGLKYRKNNIGNMQYKIIELLGLEIYLNL